MADIVKEFQLKFPLLTKSLMENTHAFSESKLSKYHLESNTWSHIMQVCLLTEVYRMSPSIKLAAFLHDLGKPLSTIRSEFDQKVKMYGHEGLSVILSIDFLKSLNISEKEMIRICQLISHHTYIYKKMREPDYKNKITNFFAHDKDLFKDLLLLTKCDALGRFSEDENREFWENIESHFEDVLSKLSNSFEPNSNFEKEAIVLIGPPMSGKSTWVSKSNLSNFTVLSRDQIIMDLGNGKNYNEAFKSLDKEVVDKEFNKRKLDSIKANDNIIFDLTHMSKKSRARTLNGLPKRYKKTGILFLTSYQILVSRNIERNLKEGKFIPEDVLHNFLKAFTFPLISEGFDEIKVII